MSTIIFHPYCPSALSVESFALGKNVTRGKFIIICRTSLFSIQNLHVHSTREQIEPKKGHDVLYASLAT